MVIACGLMVVGSFMIVVLMRDFHCVERFRNKHTKKKWHAQFALTSRVFHSDSSCCGSDLAPQELSLEVF